MSVIVNEKSNNYPIPDEGQYLGVIADVIDLGPVSTAFGTKEKVQIVWLLDAYDEEGNQFRVSAFYNKSLHEKATLRKDLRAILGQDVSGSFDLETMLGTNSNLVIQHNESGEKTYANIVAFLKVVKGTKKLLVPAEFERKIEKDGTGSSENPVNTAAKQRKAQPTLQQPSQPAQQRQAAPATRQASSLAPVPPPANSTIRRTARQAPPAPAPEPVEYVDPNEITSEDIPF